MPDRDHSDVNRLLKAYHRQEADWLPRLEPKI